MSKSNPPSASYSFAVKANLLILRATRNWLTIALVVLTFYAGMPIAAPILMKAGVTGPARIIYKFYGPMCHQFAFRSFFLFGEQYAYPRENTGTTLITFESHAEHLDEFQGIALDVFDANLMLSARGFLGNEEMGYKIALCERDIAIYLMLLLGGLLYRRPNIRQRLRPVPLWIYLLLGLGPIGLDGFSQLLGYPPFEFWPARETLPIFRAGTGALFGLMSAWIAFPTFEGAMRDTQYQIESKLWRAGIPF